MKSPAECETMADLRAQIDRLDIALIDLLADRAGYIDRAAQIKAKIGMPARTTDRFAEVVANVRRLAEARGLDPDLAEALWRQLIEWAIAREEETLGKDIS